MIYLWIYVQGFVGVFGEAPSQVNKFLLLCFIPKLDVLAVNGVMNAHSFRFQNWLVYTPAYRTQFDFSIPSLFDLFKIWVIWLWRLIIT